MCTAIRFNGRFFGRTLDFESSFGEQIVATPRESVTIGDGKNRYSILGVGAVSNGLPLYFDGVNEWGLSMAALSFPGYAVYGLGGGRSVSSSSLILMTLGLCRSLKEAGDMLQNIVISKEGEADFGVTPLHWIISDPRSAMVVESVSGGLKLYDSPLGVLTNSPDYSYHMTRLSDCSCLSPKNPVDYIGKGLYSRGMGAIGLPGDFSSSSRFLRAAYIKENMILSEHDEDMGQAFMAISAMGIPRGAVISDEGLPVYTRYTALIDMMEPAYHLSSPSCRTVRHIRLDDRLMTAPEIAAFPIYGN